MADTDKKMFFDLPLKYYKFGQIMEIRDAKNRQLYSINPTTTTYWRHKDNDEFWNLVVNLINGKLQEVVMPNEELKVQEDIQEEEKKQRGRPRKNV